MVDWRHIVRECTNAWPANYRNRWGECAIWTRAGTKGGKRKKKKSAAGHPYKCDVSCTNRFQWVMWPWVTTNCICSFHHNIQAVKRDHQEPVCLQAVWQPPTGLDSRYCYDELWAHAFDLLQWSHANVWALGKWCKLRPGWRRLKQPGEMTGESNIYS